jgi:hypothetical protein
MTCERCGGDVEYEVETADSGDWSTPYTASWLVAYVLRVGDRGFDGAETTTCGCRWTDAELARLEAQAAERANEPDEG